MENQNSSIFNFKRFCLKFLLSFICIFFVAAYLFQYFFEKTIILKHDASGAYKVNRIINELHPDEIPMFGSSRMEGSLIPEILGKNYFNYGLYATQDNVILFFLKEECKKRKTTPIIINFDLDGLNYVIGDVSYYLYNINYKPVKELVGNKDKFYYHIPLIKYYGRYESYVDNFLKTIYTKYTNHGASIEKKALSPKEFAGLVNHRKITPQKFFNNAVLLDTLISIIKSHPERKFIFVIAPYHSSFFVSFINETDANNFLQYLSDFKNVVILNYSKEPYPDSMFFNTEHLNYQGAVKYSTSLRDTLTKIL